MPRFIEVTRVIEHGYDATKDQEDTRTVNAAAVVFLAGRLDGDSQLWLSGIEESWRVREAYGILSQRLLSLSFAPPF